MGHFARECRNDDGVKGNKSQVHLAKEEELFV